MASLSFVTHRKKSVALITPFALTAFGLHRLSSPGDSHLSNCHLSLHLSLSQISDGACAQQQRAASSANVELCRLLCRARLLMLEANSGMQLRYVGHGVTCPSSFVHDF